MRYENQAFDGETLTFDGNEYINCTFRNCRIIMSGMQNGEITPFNATGIEFEFVGPAKAGKDVFQTLFISMAEKLTDRAVIRLGDRYFAPIAQPEWFKSDGQPLEVKDFR